VGVACDADAALDSAHCNRPDLVISDIAMPGTDGYELVRQLRDTPGLELVPIVALTGYGQESDRRRALAAGFNAHLIKPISVRALQDLLESLPSPEANRPAPSHV
jgi:CheY-like chemotaxis protein